MTRSRALPLDFRSHRTQDSRFGRRDVIDCESYGVLILSIVLDAPRGRPPLMTVEIASASTVERDDLSTYRTALRWADRMLCVWNLSDDRGLLIERLVRKYG